MGISDMFRKKISKDDLIIGWLAFHKDTSRSLFLQFKDLFFYENEVDMLLAFKETEYLVFWLFRRYLNDCILIDMYSKFLEGKQFPHDKLREQLEIRYRTYDKMFANFTSEEHRNNPSKYGFLIGQVLMKSIGDLDLMKLNGFLTDGKSDNVTKVFKASVILFQGIKVVDTMVRKAKHKFRIETFLRE
jgi:hypothetical protein